jgi:hypothetical protein
MVRSWLGLSIYAGINPSTRISRGAMHSQKQIFPLNAAAIPLNLGLPGSLCIVRQHTA